VPTLIRRSTVLVSRFPTWQRDSRRSLFNVATTDLSLIDSIDNLYQPLDLNVSPIDGYTPRWSLGALWIAC
jgi:hypothetical protein